jgi:hypothetical protein
MKKNNILAFLSLFTSFSTLFCCALPTLLAAIGAGSVMAAMIANVPGIVLISEHSDEIFIFAGFLLLLTGWLKYKNRYAPCPLDEEKAKACAKSRKINNYIFITSIIIYLIGAFFSYAAVHIF